MSEQADSHERIRAYIKLLGNPYASLSIYGDQPDTQSPHETAEAKRALFRKMGNPHAHSYFFDEEEVSTEPTARTQVQLELTEQLPDKRSFTKEIGGALEDLLKIYRPFVAKDQWSRVETFANEYVRTQNWTDSGSERVIKQLNQFRFSLMPNEKVQNNRAPADRIIAELKRLLS